MRKDFGSKIESKVSQKLVKNYAKFSQKCSTFRAQYCKNDSLLER